MGINETLDNLGLPTIGAMSLDICGEGRFGAMFRTVTVKYNLEKLINAAKRGKADSTPVDQPREYHPLQIVFDQCIEQAATGKGEQRHGHGVDFMEQPWMALARTHGVGFLTGQAAKKVEEAAMFLRDDDMDEVEKRTRWRNEIKGAINYLGMSLLYLDVREADEDAEKLDCCGACEHAGECHGGEAERHTGDVLLNFNPVDGTKFLFSLLSADEFRAQHGAVAWLYNPWTGQPRDPRDIGTDVLGHLITPQ